MIPIDEPRCFLSNNLEVTHDVTTSTSKPMASPAERDVHPPADRGDVSLTRASLVSVEMQRIGGATGGACFSGSTWDPKMGPQLPNQLEVIRVVFLASS